MRMIGLGIIIGFAFGAYVEAISFPKHITAYQVTTKADRQ